MRDLYEDKGIDASKYHFEFEDFWIERDKLARSSITARKEAVKLAAKSRRQ